MKRDPYTIEQEQREQDRVLGGCIIAIIILFGVMLACAGCSSHRTATSAMTATHTDSATLAITATSQATWQGAATWHRAADSLAVIITADSLTAPDGTRLHRPAITLTSRNPRAVATASHEAANSANATLAATTAASDSTTTTTDTQAATNAIYDPPDTKAIIGAALVIAAALASIFILGKSDKDPDKGPASNP